MPGDLQRRGRDARRGTPAGRPASEAPSAPRLLEQRRPQAVDRAAVLGALADGADPGRARAQLVVDEDRAADLEAGGAGEVDVGPDAGGDHDEVGGQLARRRRGSTRSTRPVAGERLGPRAECARRCAGRAARARAAQAAGRVELLLHQALGEVHDGHVRRRARAARAPPRARAGRRRSRPRALAPRGRREQRPRVRARAEGVHAGEPASRASAGRTGASRWRARGRRSRAASPSASSTVRAARVDQRAPARPRRSATPRSANQSRAAQRRAGVLRDRAGEHLREQHAVVRRLGLGADDRDVPARTLGGVVREQRLDRRHARHPAADDDEPPPRRAGAEAAAARRRAARRGPRWPSARPAWLVGSIARATTALRAPRAGRRGAARPSGTARTRRPRAPRR